MPGIEVVESDLTKNPCCQHGPMILYSRLHDGERKNFFACSTCRDRKDCSKFIWEDDFNKIPISRKQMWEDDKKKFVANVNHNELHLTYKDIKQLPAENRLFCRACCCFITDCHKMLHKNHDLITGISDFELSHPSVFLQPFEDAKNESQYFFSSITTNSLLDIIKQLNFKNVLCLGTPRIHEYILNGEEDMNSLLLDIDRRYMQFYNPNEFIWYNMFNNHFFLPNTENTLTNFIENSDGNLLLIADPPFGCRMEPLTSTILKIQAQFHEICNETKPLPLFIILPYFMEAHVKNHLKNVNMVDYKVDYENHMSFQNSPKGRKNGSPIRFFTNIKQSKIKLPADQGYKLCPTCNIWVSKENVHCDKCGKCTSKDGKTYRHCDSCERCVKPTYTHCNNCGRCALPNHNCDNIPFIKKCYNCKEVGHKQSDCPSRVSKRKEQPTCAIPNKKRKLKRSKKRGN